MELAKAILISACVVVLGGLSFTSSASAQQSFPLEKHEVRDALGRQITYYASHPKQPAPILLMIQGSGCGAAIIGQGEHAASTVFNALPFATEGNFTVVVVEKPNAKPGTQSGTALECGSDFNSTFTAQSWLTALRAALGSARELPWVDKRRTLVFGSSEGAVMAAMVAGAESSVTDVVAISSSGLSQAADLVALRYQLCFDRTRCVEDVEATLKEIAVDPNNSTKFVWGHAYQRWSSFFKVDPVAELLKSKARVYWAFGTADTSVPAISSEIGAARLAAAGKNVTVRRVPDVGHGLNPLDTNDWMSVDKEFRAALTWFWASPR